MSATGNIMISKPVFQVMIVVCADSFLAFLQEAVIQKINCVKKRTLATIYIFFMHRKTKASTVW